MTIAVATRNTSAVAMRRRPAPSTVVRRWVMSRRGFPGTCLFRATEEACNEFADTREPDFVKRAYILACRSCIDVSTEPGPGIPLYRLSKKTRR